MLTAYSWQATSASSMSGRKTAYKEKTFFEKTWPFKVSGKEKSQMLLPDNYEWPFDCILEGSLPESVEGLKDAWIIYRLKAEIGRRRGKDIVVRKPLRLVRTLDPSALELAHAMVRINTLFPCCGPDADLLQSVENIWPNKIEYSISVPSKAVIFGSFLRVDFKLIPLLKGLVIGNISTQVREEQEFVVDPDWGISALGGGQSKSDRTIATDNYQVDSEKDEQIIDEAAEGYQFSRFVELPKSLHQCLQDCNVKGIKVRHKVKFNVQLHNPDGHISELRANLPVSFYISPNLPINENNETVDQSPQASRAAVQNDLNHSAPPLYGQHMLDKLYSEVDPSGYLTPALATSPGTPYLHSRQPSHENLRSLDAITGGNSGISTPNGGSVNPAALQYRLQNLHVNGSSEGAEADASHSHNASRRNSDPHEGYFDAQTHDSSGILSRRESEEDNGGQSGLRTPFPQYAHMEDLARVPSYSTAVKTPVTQTNGSDLPTYGSAVTGAPVSLPEPPNAHLRDPNPFARSPPMNRNLRSLQSDDQRLRLMQLRGR
jgi:arrestin-related trafficking adapter 4/5/7